MNLFKPFEGGINKLFTRPPTPQVAWIQILAVGGVGDSMTMVAVIVMCLCCVLRSHLVVVTRCM